MPAVVVIPGNIAFLHQFFQVLVLVSNVAPAGSRLVVTGATASLVLPPGADGIAQTTDDPLALAQMQGSGVGGQGPGEGTVDLKNKTTGAADFGPGEDASGEVDVEGRLEGTYQVDVTINAELLGLPGGPVLPPSRKCVASSPTSLRVEQCSTLAPKPTSFHTF
jgi:hypothetical protein